ncbi:MAG: carboxypeptidase-like regulatory domain-containing protein [Bacteroidales bacterium]|nr:carboxypeptidase-like regulatory domain-containing protein [Bacteroidales bacterium]
MPKFYLVISFALLSYMASSQVHITLVVKNEKTNEAVQFCNVGIEGSGFGGITNEDGVITMEVPSSYSTDSISISHIGYEPQKIKISDIGNEKRVIFLKESAYILPEVEISSNDDEWFKILNKCRSLNIKQKNIYRAKAFYSIESTKDDLPLEVVECFYNADVNGFNVKDLAFKNGKLFLNKSESGWRTINASETYKRFDVFQETDLFPSSILCFGLSGMKKRFNVEMEFTEDLYKVFFSPKDKNGAYFSGYIFIDRYDYSLKQIEYFTDNATIYPFLPLYPDDSISKVSLSINETFADNGGFVLPELVRYDYSFDYYSRRYGVLHKVESKSFLYLYDYGESFVDPLFDFYADPTDYRKISLIPYNDVFWKQNYKFTISESKSEKIDYFEREAQTFDYNSSTSDEIIFGDNITAQIGNNTDNFRHRGFFETPYIKWDGDVKLMVHEKRPQSESSIENIIATSQKYKFVVQILLDITELDDSIHWQSFTIFDPFQSYYEYEEHPTENIFACVNIYFALCEGIRLDMEERLKKNHRSVEDIKRIYSETKNELENFRKKYFREVGLGENLFELRLYNAMVIRKFGIDYIEMFKDFHKW